MRGPTHDLLRDGTPVIVRPIEPEDRELLLAGFERLSPQSRYRRFFSPVQRLSRRQLDYLTRVDHHDHEALLALDARTGEGIGVARYVRTGPGVAEPAITVIDDWQGRGVAGVLLGRLVERALDEGVEEFVAPVLAHNTTAIRALERLGRTTRTSTGSEVELSIALEPPDSGEHPLRTLLRGVGAGAVEPALAMWHRLLPRRRAPVEVQRANRIVVGLDEARSPALAAAVALAAPASSAVHVVCAQRPLLDDRGVLDRRLRAAVGRLEAAGVEAEAHLRLGDLATVLLDVATEERARLVIVAGERERDAAGRLLGSVWNHVSHHAPCDVLIAR